MALEAGRNIFANASEELLKAQGASEANLTNLELELENYREQKDWANVVSTAEKLRTLSQFRSEILGVDNPFEAILGKYVESGLLAPAVKSEPLQEEHGLRGKKPDPEVNNASQYVVDASAVACLSLIVRRKNSMNFEYDRMRDIAVSILKPEHKDNKQLINLAWRRAGRDAMRMSKAILVNSQVTMATDLPSMLKKYRASNPDIKYSDRWQDFYGYLEKEYGNMSPEKFVINILLRFHNENEKSKLTQELAKLKEKTRVEKKREPTKFGPGDLSPAEEITLCTEITKDKTYAKIKDIFDGHDPMEVAISHGYKCPSGNFKDCLLENREKMAELRNNKPIVEKEGEEVVRKIQKAINIMSRDRRGWHKLNPDYKALQFIYALVAETNNDPTMVQDIIEAIFPEKTYTVDAKNSFFIMPGIGGNDK
jgi:hypothetical protein